MTRSRDLSNSQANLGVAIPPVAAGKNAVINGAMEFWQRGTSFSAAGYTADRWYSSGTNAITRSTTAPTGFNYSLNWVTAGSYPVISQYVELPVAGAKGPFTGTWTASFYAKASTATTMSTDVQWIDGSTRANPVQIVTQGNALTTSWQRFTMPVNMDISSPIGSSKALEFVFYVATGGATLNITGVQLEPGSVATPFARAGGTIQGELAACQRYYYRQTAGGTTYSGDFPFAMGTGAAGGTSVYAMVNFPVTMRTQLSTTIDYSGLDVLDGSNARITVTNVTLQQAGNVAAAISITVASGITQYRPYFLNTNNNNTGYLGFSAEL